jgi:hypothetical protein
VTVCIAAVCEKGTIIVGAADRMITARNTEFEVPSLSKERANAPILKVVPLNRHVIAMISGDAGFQSQALQHLWEKLTESRNADPKSTFSNVRIEQIGQYYTEFCNARMHRATNNLLAPYGLTAESFLDKQKSLASSFVEFAVSEIEKIRRSTGCDIIFCGFDESGPHILICNGSDSSSSDTIGFAAIGSGSEHAESQFMLAQHTRDDSLADTSLLTYTAKKRWFHLELARKPICLYSLLPATTFLGTPTYYAYRGRTKRWRCRKKKR